jgi:acyl carrier protein
LQHPDLHHQLVSILAEVFQVEFPASLEDVSQDELEEWDSFNHLRLVSDLEDIFQITIDDVDIPEMTSLKQVKALLQRYGTPSVDQPDT